MATVPRRIYFYKVGFFEDQDGEMVEIAPTPSFEYVRTLRPQDADPSRYMTLGDGNQLIMEMATTPNNGVTGSLRGRFGIKRLTGLPQVELAGAYSDLQLAAGAGLAELRHFVVYPARKILGLELNGNAPGPGRWGGYLMYKCPHVDLVRTDIVLSGTSTAVLNRLGRVAGATFTVYADQIDEVGELDDNLKRGLRALKKTSDNARKLSLTFELGSQKKDEDLDLDWKSRLGAFLRSSNGRQSVDKFSIRAFDPDAGYTQWIDLLEDKLVGYKKVVTLDAAGRVIDSSSMFSAIDEVFSTLPANL